MTAAQDYFNEITELINNSKDPAYQKNNSTNGKFAVWIGDQFLNPSEPCVWCRHTKDVRDAFIADVNIDDKKLITFTSQPLFINDKKYVHTEVILDPKGDLYYKYVTESNPETHEGLATYNPKGSDGAYQFVADYHSKILSPLYFAEFASYEDESSHIAFCLMAAGDF